MSVVAIHPRTHSPAASPRPNPARAGSARRRSPSTAQAPVLRVTVDVPLLGERLTPELSLLLELVRDLVDRGEGAVAVTDLTGGTAEAGPFGTRPAPDPPKVVGDDDPRTLRVLTAPRMVLREGVPVPFTRLEFDLLVFLARHPRRVFTRRQLLSGVWGYEHAVARTVDVHVRRLRAKAGDQIPLVTTVHGVGYRLADDAPVRLDDGDERDAGAVPDAEMWGPGVSLL